MIFKKVGGNVMKTIKHSVKALKKGAAEDELAEALYRDIEEIILKYQEPEPNYEPELTESMQESTENKENREDKVQEIVDLLYLEQ